MKSIDGFGNNFPGPIGPAPTQFSLTFTKPAHIRVTWGANSDTPQGPTDGVNITASITGPGGTWAGSGNQTNGSVTSSSKSTDKVAAGDYVLTLTPTSSLNVTQGEPKATNITISNQCSYPR